MVSKMNGAVFNSNSAPPGGSGDPIEELPVAYVEVNADGVITRSNRAASPAPEARPAPLTC